MSPNMKHNWTYNIGLERILCPPGLELEAYSHDQKTTLQAARNEKNAPGTPAFNS